MFNEPGKDPAMTKLSKPQLRAHQAAMARLDQDDLTFHDRWRIYEDLHEGALGDVTAASAYFTPMGFAADFGIDACGMKVVDLCAGIGSLAFAYYHTKHPYGPKPDITCVEINPAYVEIGRKLFPEATWICADVFDIWPDLGRFDCAISNPPFGRMSGKGRASPRYQGADFEYKIIDIASHIANFGTFIIPQGSSPFRYSGQRCYDRNEPRKFQSFQSQTGIDLEAGCGIDTTVFQDDWKCVSPMVEVVTAEFPQIAVVKQLSLFEAAA